jgi:hypothetical protein
VDISLIQAIKRRVPRALKQAAKDAWRRLVLSVALMELRALRAGEMPTRRSLSRLRYGWGNEGWSADVDYLEELARAAIAAEQPILECGCGLTTLLLGVLASARGVEVWSLEESESWHALVSRRLARPKVGAVKLCLAPLRDYGGFRWYALPPGLPQTFALVVCDGPGESYEARYGLMPVLGARLAARALILVDDAAHMAEVLPRWHAEMPLETVHQGPRVAVLRIATAGGA